eukprot:TRINITY_DN33810_c0_g1_i1.p1 TRINITY_DN33810_c0_g1~~TRINITY_DN33810_c0_g1_i1.p1  ORF type:complete len:433 (+),score=40.34 TRINITY_DN33810_c0_g1_i1:98-1396(+)
MVRNGQAGGTISVKVFSDNGFGDVMLSLKQDADVEEAREEYAKEKGIPASAVVIRSKESGKVVRRERSLAAMKKGLRAKVKGLPALKCLFDVYDSVGKVPVPNQRPEAGTKVQRIVLGGLLIDTWNPSPYPRFINPLLSHDGTLFICDVCLRYSPIKMWMEHHIRHHGGCAQGSSPPGRCVFTSSCQRLSVWEVNGGISYDNMCESGGLPADGIPDVQTLRTITTRELFCQNVALLTRFFLKGKTAFYGTGAFLYYVLTEFADGAWRFRGYYSVEKGSSNSNSLACIMVLPPWQDKGYGRLLIHLSYMLCRPPDGSLSEKSPERPLSELGMCTFLSYWRGAVLTVIHSMVRSPEWQSPLARKGGKDIEHIIRETVIRKRDVLKALHTLDLLTRPGTLGSELDWEAAKKITSEPRRHELQYFEGGTFHDKRIQ